jgi:hypothetical protein
MLPKSKFYKYSCSSADFLKIDNTNITFIESGAVAIAGITTDNEVRAGIQVLLFKLMVGNAPI